jgi:chaperonin GroEL
MAKQVSFQKEAQEKLLKGLNLTADAVIGTFGPKGKNVFLYDKNQIESKITNDGVSVANKIVLEDIGEDAGAWLIRNVSAAQLDMVGDGTTLVTLLTKELINECLKRPENSMQIRESLKEESEKVLKELKKKSIPITKDDIQKVALISAEDKELAKIIADIINKIGDKAVINVEDSKTFETNYEIVEGYEADVGFISPYFINQTKSSKAVYEDVLVLCTEKKISNLIDIKPLFDEFNQQGITQCVIVCDDIEDSMLGLFVGNKQLGRFNALVIKATGELLKDIAGVTGSRIVSDTEGLPFKNLKIAHLGKAKKVVCDANKTLFIGEGAKNYADRLQAKADNEPNQFVKKTIERRIAKLKGGVAILRIGAPTDPERTYLKDKAEDAVKAVKAALEEGISEGGGMAMWRIAQEIEPKTIGGEILKKILTKPLQKIIENAGKDYTEILLGLPEGMGYDAKKDKYAVMTDIIDPTKVLMGALINAVSTASSFITINSVVYDAPEKQNK